MRDRAGFRAGAVFALTAMAVALLAPGAAVPAGGGQRDLHAAVPCRERESRWTAMLDYLQQGHGNHRWEV
jgi:hypothetical protein